MTCRWLSSAILGLVAGTAHAGEPFATAHYLAKEGVLVARGETKILFDPLFHYPHPYYQAVPAEMEAALPAQHPAALADFDIFTEPGETRPIEASTK